MSRGSEAAYPEPMEPMEPMTGDPVTGGPTADDATEVAGAAATAAAPTARGKTGQGEPGRSALVFDDPLGRPGRDELDSGWGGVESGRDEAWYRQETPPHHGG